MAHIHRHALLMYSDQQMFDLVNRVRDYPHYLEGCAAVEVFSETETHMLARLDLEKKGIKLSFTTSNSLDAPKSIIMALEDGPFDEFEGRWFFQRLDDNACKVNLDIQFELSSKLKGIAAAKLFDSVANNLVDAVVSRAKKVYG
jgi:ribosome-associated toxin RatA of RatAB toxin-antitoxin module